MSRVTRSTLRTAAAGGLIAASLGLAACGGSDTSQASTPSTPAPTVDQAAAKFTPQPIPQVIKSKVAVTKEGKKAIAAASTKRYSADQLKRAADDLFASLKAAGLKPRSAAGSAGGPRSMQAGASSTIMIYPSEQLAATQVASFITVVKTAGTDGRIARYGRVVAATWAPDGMTKKSLDEWHKVNSVVKKAQA